MWYTLYTHVLAMWYTLYIHVLAMWCTLYTHVLAMWCTLDTHVLAMWCTLDTHVLPMWLWSRESDRHKWSTLMHNTTRLMTCLTVNTSPSCDTLTFVRVGTINTTSSILTRSAGTLVDVCISKIEEEGYLGFNFCLFINFDVFCFGFVVRVSIRYLPTIHACVFHLAIKALQLPIMLFIGTK